jgi:hypothetical protein
MGSFRLQDRYVVVCVQRIVILSAIGAAFVFLFGYEMGRVEGVDEEEYQAGQLQGFRDCVRLRVREENRQRMKR